LDALEFPTFTVLTLANPLASTVALFETNVSRVLAELTGVALQFAPVDHVLVVLFGGE
jgi:hypothetical protein